MAFLVSLAFLFLYFILFSILKVISPHKKRTVIPTNWPILGMAPAMLVNAHRLHDYITEILIQTGGTFLFKGPWFAKMDMVITTDPLDIHHILSKNFSTYPRGENFRKIFDILGDGIISADGEIWEISHKFLFSMFKHPGFQTNLETIIFDKVETGLLPVLESICERGTEVDLQDIFHRFAFDNVCKLLVDNDPESLSLDFPYHPCLTAFSDAEEAMLLRHVTPPFLWKFQQVFGLGKEKKLINAWKHVDDFIYKILAQKQKEYNNMKHDEEKYILFSVMMRELVGQIGTEMDPTRFIRDTLVNLMAAGKDTIGSGLSWFFYILARNPHVEVKILEEIHRHLEVNSPRRWNTKELDKMVYLHGAICEALRLYPSLPCNTKSPSQPDILPSGHKVDQNMNIILSFYSMGRMKSIWGEDCTDVKPERWISNSGGIKHEPSYKFAVFNSGPRTCLGKNMALFQLKMVSTAIIYRYNIQLVEGHPVVPADSMILDMKHGLKVRLNKRGESN